MAKPQNYEAPTGMGVFFQALKPMKETPKQVAKICKDNGVNNAALFAVCQHYQGTGQIDSSGTMKRYADAFRSKGIRVWFWGFPYCGKEELFVNAMETVTKSVGCDGWIIDPEVSYKWRTPAQAKTKRAAACNLRDMTIAAWKGPLGMTSYGMVDFHKNFPWKELTLKHGFGVPQLYLPDVVNSKEAAKLVDKGLVSWEKLTPDNWIIPAVPAFGANSGAKMHDFLSDFVGHYTEIGGMLVWSFPQISRDEWRIIARWADWFERGIATP